MLDPCRTSALGFLEQQIHESLHAELRHRRIEVAHENVASLPGARREEGNDGILILDRALDRPRIARVTARDVEPRIRRARRGGWDGKRGDLVALGEQPSDDVPGGAPERTDHEYSHNLLISDGETGRASDLLKAKATPMPEPAVHRHAELLAFSYCRVRSAHFPRSPRGGRLTASP